MAVSSFALQINGSVHMHLVSHGLKHLKTSLSSTVKPFLEELQHNPMKIDVSAAIRNTSARFLDAFVDSIFHFADIPYLPSQKNFAPVEEIGGLVEVTCIEGQIPADFPEGVYLRNGSNPQFGSLQSTVSMFGRSSQIWVEGEGMIHALYLKKNACGQWAVSYNNRYVETETFKLQKQRNQPIFLPAVEGDSIAVAAGTLLNMVRFGAANGYASNTTVFEHSGKFYAIAENYLPQEIDISTLETYEEWNVNGAWNRPFTSHPKRAPESGELVIMGFDAVKPYYVVGIVTADGKKLSHKVDLKFNRCCLSHEIGVTEKYNIIMDYPLTIDVKRLLTGGSFLKFQKDGYAKIGVMPRYGDADSVQWFEVQPHCTFHLLNCFEDDNEVVVRGCRSCEAIIPGPDWGQDKFEWFSRGFKFTQPTEENPDSSIREGYLFTRVYEWRLNIVTGEVKERNLSGNELSMDFPMINEKFTGLKHKYGYTQVVDSVASSSAGNVKYGGLAKLYLDEPHQPEPLENGGENNQVIEVGYHKFAENIFCSGTVFAGKPGGSEEDDGWLVSFVHNEETNVSQVHIIDAKKMESEPVAKIALPQRVPYGFHGTFVPIPSHP
ncbi:hypothetical protein Dsin_017684 [Dipteronia sinensis]|uniref:Carotenoid 9,10(9',10')-cleavage dioxygenase 1-like n=1 Tax=Dipteronia sinensis TaxID=43782 RepID=A0AAE0E853_9ROSI|nr:hypothetical protein Dsin_017684 [Dipteronia sinensis]